MGYGSQGTKKDRAASAANKPKKERFNETVFINYELDKTAQAACKAWSLTSESAFHALLGLLDEGYRVTLKFDDYSDSYASFMQQQAAEGVNYGFTLTGRGSTPEKALKQLLYKHFEVMGELWEQFAGAPRGSEIDD